MSGKPVLEVRKPVSVLNRPLEFNLRKLLPSLGKAGVEAVSLNLAGTIKESIGALESLGLGKDPGQIAWLLIQRSLRKALSELVKANSSYLRTEPNDGDEIDAQALEKLESSEVTIDRSFFHRPGNLPLINDLKNIFALWLQNHGVEPEKAYYIASGLPAHFTGAINEELRDHQESYAPVSAFFSTAVTPAAEREFKWLEYGSYLQRRVREPMFTEPFSLEDVYVPLRGYYKQEIAQPAEERREGTRHGSRLGEPEVLKKVVDATQSLREWFNDSAGHRVKVLSGDPGAGKSTFARMLAAELAAKGERVIFVPLHALDLKRPIVDSVHYWAGFQPSMPDKPLDIKRGDPRLLVIFDGLDELAMAGKASKDLAEEFVGDVNRLLKGLDDSDAQIKVLITGREIVVQAVQRNYSQAEQILHLLPYFLDQRQRLQYMDPNTLLDADQRDIWWKKYGQACGRGFDGLPEQLRHEHLIPITAEPLLNYLVAVVYDPKDSSAVLSGNRNEIYGYLLDKVHARVWEPRRKKGSGGAKTEQFRKHPGSERLKLNEFRAILEEIALAAWHSEGRSTTVEAVKERCEAAGLTCVLEEYEGEAEKGLLRLLTAFYIRKSEHGRLREATFEFTHKSFGEYLTACGIVRMVQDVHEEFERHGSTKHRGWDKRKCLVEWALLCGPTAMDLDLLQFVRDQVRLNRIENVKAWQETLAHLFEYMLQNGMPMESVGNGLTYQEQSTHARNAEEALLFALNACVRVTGPDGKEKGLSEDRWRPQIKWPSDTAFGTWVHRLRGQSGDFAHSNRVALQCLGGLDLKGCLLHRQDLCLADLSEANLSKADLTGAHLKVADLTGADLTGADLTKADLSSAKLTGAHLSGADLSGADLSSADLRGADLRGANLEDADLILADLSEAFLTGAELSFAELSFADLTGADLTGADLTGANLEHVKIDRDGRKVLERFLKP